LVPFTELLLGFWENAVSLKQDDLPVREDDENLLHYQHEERAKVDLLSDAMSSGLKLAWVRPEEMIVATLREELSTRRKLVFVFRTSRSSS